MESTMNKPIMTESESEVFTNRIEQIDVSYRDRFGAAETLATELPHMCAGDDTVELNVCSISTTAFNVQNITSLKQLEKYLEVVSERSDANSDDESICLKLPNYANLDIFFLHQTNSRGRLTISETGLKLLLEHTRAFSQLGNLLQAFTPEDGPFNEGRSGIHAECTIADKQSGPIFETAYVLKHVELNGKSGTAIGWSIRQFAIYQKFHTESKRSACIFVQTPLNVLRRMSEIKDSSQMYRDVIDHWTCLHLVCIGTLGSNWACYIKFLEKKIAEIYNFVQFAKLESGHSDEVTFKHLQQLNLYCDLLIRAEHVLRLNSAVLNTLLREAKTRKSQDITAAAPRYDVFQTVLGNCLDEHSFIINHISMVHERAERIAVMLRDTIALRDNESMKHLTMIAVQESGIMRTLTEQMTREARTVKTITILTLVYLPASFTSTFLGMGFIHVESINSVLRLNVSQDLLFYLIITMPLMIVTFLGWFLWELRSRHVEKKKLSLTEKPGEV